MIRKYPKLNERGFRRLEFYMTIPPEENYEELYEITVGYLIDLTLFNNESLDSLFRDVKSVMELIYNMEGFTRRTHYILYRYNMERLDYLKKKITL